jgi:hypothetical protein
MYLLPDLDQAGRAVFVSTKPKYSYGDDWKIMARWIWYIMEAALENPSVQQHGALGLGVYDGPFSIAQYDRKLQNWVIKLASNKFHPIRCVAIHHCFDSKVFEFIIPFMLGMMGPDLRARYRMYPGYRRHERLGAFKEMGLAKEMLPVSLGGAQDYDVSSWLAERQDAGI